MNSLKIFVIQPVSIAGRLIVSSITDGIKQNFNNAQITIFDELFDGSIRPFLEQKYDVITGYDFSPLKIKIDNKLSAKCICYFSDNIESKTSGPEWEKYFKYLYDNDVYTFFWDREMIKEYHFKNLYYLPHFVNFDVYKDLKTNPEFDVMFAGRLDTDLRLRFFEGLSKRLSDLRFAWYAIERHYKDALERTLDREFIKTAYQGFIDNEPQMAKAINNAKILFNINAQGISSLNYRTIQTVACKRLMISDKRGELSLFEGNMPYYNDIDDLVKKIRFYIDNNQEYNKVTEACWKIGYANYNSGENVKFMFDKVLTADAQSCT